MSTFLQVVPQESCQNMTSGIRISRNGHTGHKTKTEFDNYVKILQTNPGQSLYDYCLSNDLSYETLRGYASRNKINIRKLRKESLSAPKNGMQTEKRKQSHSQPIHVMVNVRNASFDIPGISVEQLSTLIERVANNV